ncbi:MAG: hypothetical protein KCCBMMGE_00173 [Candidatus Methanoperedenaceae archaeon GB37]|nr:MAG: hypothetical protein KCCBMMGE_00173 [Candidatus Methanoperedenaceae archaeon GB37]CAD7778553.1 hypothetical protein DMNBHIDG_01824 [Candidatus Methanoperedenaceae archaeon GB37]
MDLKFENSFKRDLSCLRAYKFFVFYHSLFLYFLKNKPRIKAKSKDTQGVRGVVIKWLCPKINHGFWDLNQISFVN